MSRSSLSCLAAGCLLALAACATTSKSPPPTANESLPPDLRVGQNEVLQEVMTTHGDETYVCRRLKSDASTAGIASPSSAGLPGMARDGTQLRWDPLGSEALLVDASGQSVGTVAPGRYFLAYDGSYVIGKVAAESQVGANALTWVRYTARFVAARRPGEGRLADISSIQRIDTSGGLPPLPTCELEGAHLLVPYGATYMFYRAKGLAPVALSANQASH